MPYSSPYITMLDTIIICSPPFYQINIKGICGLAPRIDFD